VAAQHAMIKRHSLAFSILCRSRPFELRRAQPARAMCTSPAAGNCRDWGDDVWDKQLNIRDLESPEATSQQFYRTSCVFAPNKPADLVDTLVSSRRMSVVLDLRSLDEMKTDVEVCFDTMLSSLAAPFGTQLPCPYDTAY